MDVIGHAACGLYEKLFWTLVDLARIRDNTIDGNVLAKNIKGAISEGPVTTTLPQCYP